MDKNQEHLDASYELIDKIDHSVQELFHPTDKQFILPKVNNLYNELISFSEVPYFGEGQKENALRKDELSSNIFLATLYLYFAFTILDEVYGDLIDKKKDLFARITLFIANISKKTNNTLNCFLEELFRSHHSIHLHPNSCWEMLNYRIFFILAKYYTLANDKQQIYKNINDAILQNKHLEQWMNVLEILVFIHSAQISNSEEKRELPEPNLVKQYCREFAVLSIVKSSIDYKELFPYGLRRNFGDDTEYSDFEVLLYIDDASLEKYPCISYLLYKSIHKMTYHKCKSFFTENINPPKPFDDNEKFRIYASQELEKFSFTDFKGAWAQNRIQKMMFFAIDILTTQKANKKALENGEWCQPEKQKQLLNDIMSFSNIPAIKNSFDFSTFNDEAFSATETALNLLYNIACFNENGKASDIIQQINFIDEQRSRLFAYPDVKPTTKDLKDDKPESNQKNPKFFDNFCPQSRDNLVKEIETMTKIDCGFPLPMQVQLFPTYNNKAFARKQNCKLFLETDTACNLRHEEFYRNRYKNMLQTRYIYPARNMATHYSRYTPTESLLEEKNFTDLANFLYDAKSRLQNEQDLRNLKQDLKNFQLHISPLGHSWLCLKNSFDKLIDNVLIIIDSPEYTGKLRDNDIQQINEFETSKEILDILYEVKANYKLTNKQSEILSQCIQFFETHHPDLYCLIKDIINQKEYTGKLNNHHLDEFAKNLSPATRYDNLYYTLSDIRNDYPVNNDTAKELDLYISNYKRDTIVIPKENPYQLNDLFHKTEEFFFKNKDSFVKAIEKAFKDKDFDKLHNSKNFLDQYLMSFKIIDADTRSSFFKIGQSIYEKTASFSLEEKKVFDTVVEIVFHSISEFALVKKIESKIRDNEAKSIYASIKNIEYLQNYFYHTTGFSQSEIEEQICDYAHLYKVKVIQQSANNIKTILNNFKVSNKELEIFDSNELWKLIDLREFDKFNERVNQMMQIVDKYILFHYKKDHNWNLNCCFRNEKERVETSNSIYKNKITVFQKLIKEKNIDKLKLALKQIEYFELPKINFSQEHLNCYNNYLNYIDSLETKCNNLENSEILQLVQNIHNKIEAKKQDAKQEYDKNSVEIFKNDNTYDSFLIEYVQKFLLNTIKYCTESSEVRNVLHKNKKTFLNKDGRLGLNKDEKISDDIHYPEDFKSSLRQFLNTIFGVTCMCSASKKDDYDSIDYGDIQETDVNFFDQYNKQILLYLIRVTVELAHVKKIEI